MESGDRTSFQSLKRAATSSGLVPESFGSELDSVSIPQAGGNLFRLECTCTHRISFACKFQSLKRAATSSGMDINQCLGGKSIVSIPQARAATNVFVEADY